MIEIIGNDLPLRRRRMEPDIQILFHHRSSRVMEEPCNPNGGGCNPRQAMSIFACLCIISMPKPAVTDLRRRMTDAAIEGEGAYREGCYGHRKRNIRGLARAYYKSIRESKPFGGWGTADTRKIPVPEFLRAMCSYSGKNLHIADRTPPTGTGSVILW